MGWKNINKKKKLNRTVRYWYGDPKSPQIEILKSMRENNSRNNIWSIGHILERWISMLSNESDSLFILPKSS